MMYDEFVEKASGTMTGEYHLTKLDGNEVLSAIEDFIAAGERLDQLKKAFAYGSSERIAAFNGLGEKSPDTSVPYHFPVDEGILHGILGMATEAVEMVEALYEAMYETGELDLVNLKEEIGDSDWYKTLLVKTGQEESDIRDTVIAKLAKRYPEKFTQEADLARDIKAERKILEGN